ncbi:DUF1559 family PulG-like putative transporter [Anatilimnocola floriformis]|uniref:DUF1559 family PulG-like putative transporter n=1 Tax=Anatilimnocola floriformis TaxID=2948575 RepID=UPI0020C1FCA6|nr:DUF1559 domain-containing protein [Anatilimnocola floriformis]
MTRVLLQRPRRGGALIDCLAVVAMGAIGACLLLPALADSRQLSDVNGCTANLQALGKSFLAFERSHGGLPPRRTGGFGNIPYGGWGAQILPQLNEKLGGEFKGDYDFFDPINKKVVETRISEFICPAAPADRKVVIRSNASAASINANKDTLFEVDAGPNDYISCNGFFMPRTGYGMAWNDGGQNGGNQRQAMTDTDNRPLTDITDGLSLTILIVEKAGAPAAWRVGKKIGNDDMFAGQNNSRGAWAGYGSIAYAPMNPTSSDVLRSARGDSTDCSVNCNNTFGIYGFHEKGANILLCDGAVRFVTPKLDGLTFGRLTTRDDGQLIADEAF